MIRRLYDPGNVPKLVAFGRKWHAKLGFPQAYSPERAEMLLKASFMAPDRAVWGAFDDKQVVGILVACIEPFAFMEGNYVTDVCFAAEKEGAGLFHAMLQWGKTHGACAVQAGVTSGVKDAEKFYEALKMTRVGSVYIKSLEAV